MVGKRVWCDMGAFTIYPNLYVVYVAPPGGRKSTAMSFIVNMVKQTKASPLGFDCVTKELLVGAMRKNEVSFAHTGGAPKVYTPLLLAATELSELIGASKEGMINFLTTIYDYNGEYTAGTIKRGEEKINDPCLVLVGCCTPAWVTARLRDDVISGGFSRRAIWVYELDRPQRVTFPEVAPVHQAAWDWCVEHYNTNLKNVYGGFTWTPDSKRFMDSWYQTYEVPDLDSTRGYYESKQIQVLKVAMLDALGTHCVGQPLILDVRNIENALALLAQIEVNLPKVFQGVGGNKLNALAAKAYELVTRFNGMMLEVKLTTLLFSEGNHEEIKQALDHMINNAQKLFRMKNPITGKVYIVSDLKRAEAEKQQNELMALKPSSSSVGGSGAPVIIPD